MPAKSQIEALLQQIRNLLEAQESESPVLTGEVLALVEEVTDILLDLEPTDEVLAWLRTLRSDVQINKWVVTSDTEAALQAKLSEALEEARSFVVEDIDLSWDEVSDKPSTFPPTSHTHTASQIDDLEQVIADLIEALELGEVTWSIIQDKPATFPPDAHTHPTSEVDGFEAEVQALIEGSSLASVEWDNVTGKPTAFPPVSHTHSWSQITERPTEFPPASHSHVTGDITGLGDFVDAAVEAADIQWDNIIGKPAEFPPVPHTHPWGEITGKPNTFPPSPHDHDDLYYRKAHIDNTFVPRARTLTMEGAENQITITPEGAQSLNNNRTWSFTLPQDIHTEADPTFNRPFFSDGMQHAGNILPDVPLESSLGSAARRYLSAHVADLRVTNLVTENLRSTIWGGLLTGLGNEVAAPATSGATTMQFRHNNFSDGHVVLLQRPGEIEYIRIYSEASGTGPYTYDVIRNLQGTGGKSWSEGDGAFSEGVAGTGWIEQYAINAVTTGASITGPGMVFMRRTGPGLSSKDYRAAVGYLEGYYGQGSDTWGIGAGVRTGQHLVANESGVYLRDNNSDLLRADGAGLFVDAEGTFSGTVSFQDGEIAGNITMGGSITSPEFVLDADGYRAISSGPNNAAGMKIVDGDNNELYRITAVAGDFIAEVANEPIVASYNDGATINCEGANFRLRNRTSGVTNSEVTLSSTQFLARHRHAPSGVERQGSFNAVGGIATMTSNDFTNQNIAWIEVAGHISSGRVSAVANRFDGTQVNEFWLNGESFRFFNVPATAPGTGSTLWRDSNGFLRLT